MGRFITPIVESVGPGPSVMAPGDGLEGNYHAFLNSVPANGKCLVVVPGLDPLHHLEAICPPNAAGSIGDPVLVNVDDDKQLWVVTPTFALPPLRSLGIARGVATLTFAAATNSSGVVTVTHGLGVVPVAVTFGATNAPAFGQIPLCNWISGTTTTFGLNGELKTAFTGTIAVTWIACA